MRALILEDDRDRRVAMTQRLMERLPFLQISFFETAPEMIAYLKSNEVPDLVIIALDNDLELIPQPSGAWLDPGTGLDVAEWLAKLPEPRCPVVVHTTNAPYAEKMMACLNAADWQAERVIPYNDLEWIDREWFAVMRKLILEFSPKLAAAAKP
ncbi:cyclic-phosphate processing receiver domain-containing protein [Rubinisphaera sp. JC750]|uniref:cyclic-phosphate processing receiver domain-containing protein n=1 Tax=Rubinisphaera sp. JC750 TaxID=2898658 RepID=UPI001F2DAAB8|nr:cyclic-phosphate processing receiver domain-containing protein [Rubinisphaera sp. JC750]